MALGARGQAVCRVRKAWGTGLLAVALWGAGAVAHACGIERDRLCFGILPLNGPLESRNDWQPLIDALAEAVGMPVDTLATTSYEALGEAVQRQEVDISFLSGRMALDAVTLNGMRVVAQIASADGQPGYRAVIVAHAHGAVTPENMLNTPGQWRLARGAELSMSGYVVPNLELFLPAGISPPTYFTEEIVGTHQDTALAVATGQADLATNNSADLARFSSRFPAEHARLKVVWESQLIPHAHIVVRSQLPQDIQHRVGTFLHQYGRGEGEEAERQRQVLTRLHNLSGFMPADNRSLEYPATINHALARQKALQGEWVSDAALQEHLRRIDDAYEKQIQYLREIR